jgi:ligand-binding sensor domain-containing protein/AraC-like DNA-binding protein
MSGRGFAKQIFIILFFHLFIYTISLFPLNPDIKPDKFIIKRWQVKEGLQINSISAISQTKEGFIWVGTIDGLSRFDGVEFKIYKNSELNNIKDIFTNSDNNLIISEKNNIYINKGESFIPVLKNKICIEKIIKTKKSYYILDCKGNIFPIFIKSDKNKLNKINLNGIKPKSIYNGFFGGFFIVDRENNIYYFNKKIKNINKKSDKFPEISTMYEDSSGRLWVGTIKGLYIYNKGKLSFYKGGKDRIYSSKILSIFEDRENNIYAGTSEGGIRILKNRSEIFLKGIALSVFFEDKNGGLWIGTNGWGLYYMYEGIIKTLSKGDGLCDFISLIKKTDSGDIIAASNFMRKIYKKEKNGFKEFEKLRGEKFTALESVGDTLWIGTEEGLIRYFAGVIKFFRQKDGLTDNFIQVLFNDSRNRLWIGTYKGGINILKGDRIYPIKGNEQLKNITIYTFYEDDDNNIYIGTSDNLILFGKGEPNLNKGEILLKGLPILSIKKDSSGELFIGTYGKGLIRYKAGKICRITTENGLKSNFISSVSEDKDKSLWLGTLNGIESINKKELIRFCSGDTSFIKTVSYGINEGMKSEECSLWSQNSVLKLKNKILFATKQGIAVLSLKDIKKVYRDGISPIIKDIYINGEKIRHNRNNHNFREIKQLKIFFTAPCFTSPDDLTFLYKLDGFEKDWIIINKNKERYGEYENLPPGKFCFKLLAINKTGRWSKKPAEFCFYLNPVFYKRKWFKFLILFIIVIIFLEIIIFKIRKKKGEKQSYREFSVNEEHVKIYLKRLKKALRQEKLFLDEELTLGALAEHIKIPSYLLSYLINERLNKNFSSLVNELRVEEAKKKLSEPEYSDITILEIAFSSGFKTKAAFNRAFKKYTNMTPSEFRKKHSIIEEKNEQLN